MMIAAIYARKSTDQNIVDEEKSVTRQIEHARAYAERNGWSVAAEHVYSDDGISGAEFVKRPGLTRLLNAAEHKPRPFDVLIMSEESRLGREQIETSYVLKQLTDAGIRVFLYLDDRERTLDSAMDKVMLSLNNFASEMEREKARQRTYDAMLRKARAQQVTGGKVYGYRNEEILSAEGRRLHVVRKIDPAESAVVRRIFSLYAQGIGMVTIAKTLNAERVAAPRGHGWAPSAIREILHRPLYQGNIVWNQRQKITRGGTKKLRKRPESEWLRLEAPELRIISADLWDSVQNRLAHAQEAFPRSLEGGRLLGRPAYSDRLDQYLLTGFATCGVCGGAIAADARVHGTAPNKRLVRLYGCTFHRRRGDAICTNAVLLRQEVLDHAILQAISEVLDEHILDAAVDKALAKLRAGQQDHLDRRTQIERELSLITGRMDRAMDALLNGGPKDELIARLNDEKSRKQALTEEVSKLGHLTSVVSIDAPQLKRDLRTRVADVKALLGRHTPQARQMLRKLLVGKIAMEPVAAARQRGYRVRGALAIGRLLTGEAFEPITGRTVVTPAGFGTSCRTTPLRIPEIDPWPLKV